MSNRVLLIVSVTFVGVIFLAGLGMIGFAKYQRSVAADPQTRYAEALEAVKAHDATRLGVLVDRYPGVAHTRSALDGRVLLHHTMEQGGDLACTTILIEAGADVTVADELGRTPLHELCTYTEGLLSPEVVKLLADHGADMNAVDHEGVRPIDQMVDIESDRYAQVFPDYFTNPTTENRKLLMQYGAEK